MSNSVVSRPIGCPIEVLLRALSREWTVHIVWTLARAGATRFTELRRLLPGEASARMLSLRLRELAALGVVTRHEAGGYPRHVEYALTPAGVQLDTLLRETERLATGLPATLAPHS